MFVSLRWKLLLCCIFLVTLTGGLAGYGLYAVHDASNSLSQVYDQALIGISSGRAAAAKLVEARALMERALAAADGATPEQIAALRRLNADVAEDLTVVRNRVQHAEVSRTLDAAEAARAEWMQDGLMVIAPPNGGSAVLPRPESLQRKAAEASATLDDAIDQVAAIGFQMRSAAAATLQARRVTMVFATSGIATIGIAFALGFAQVLTRSIRAATRVAERIAGGNYTDVIVSHGRDELGRLLNSLSLMQANLLGRVEHDRALLRRLRELSDSTFEGLLIHRDGVVLDANAAFCALVDLPLEQVRGMAVGYFTSCWEDALTPLLAQAGEATQDRSMREIVIRTGQGESMPVEIQSREISYADGPAWVTALRDIRDRRATEDRARFLAYHDTLTGLPNRRQLKERLAEAGRTRESNTALMFLDLDRFKAVNDTKGHAAGDALLVEVGLRLLKVVGPRNMVARIGGDEFVVLCDGLSVREVANLGEEIRKSIEAPFVLSGRPFHISVSIGTALGDQSGNIDLIQAADMAMYAAKQGGGNRGITFDKSLFEHAAEQLEMEQELRRALSTEGELTLLYQPVLRMTSAHKSRLIGFEALVRWRHPTVGLMAPGRFIPMAEKSGLILPLGDWVMTTALRQGRDLQRICQNEVLTINVNVSVLQLKQAGFCSGLAEMLLAEDFPPSSLCLEVVESMLSDTTASSALDEVRRLGVKVAIDDFGVGYSSLSYLRRLPVDVVKLDRSFLEDADCGNAGGDRFISAVVALAHAVGKLVVLEGIETHGQSAIGYAAGADMVQGYLFAPPLSEHAAREFVVQHQHFASL